MSLKPNLPVLPDLTELWKLNPGMFAAPNNKYDIRKLSNFKRLGKICRDEYPNSGKSCLDHSLLEALISLGMPACLPKKYNHKTIPLYEAAHKLDKALRAEEHTCLYLAPLDCAIKLPNLAFGSAKICHPDKQELERIFDLPKLHRYFNPDKDFGMSDFSGFQWLIVEETKRFSCGPEGRGGIFANLGFPNGCFNSADYTTEKLGRIIPLKDRYPEEFKTALFFLLLAPWEKWTSGEINWRGFRIPWVYTVDNDLFRPPESLPSLKTLTWEPVGYEDDYGKMQVYEIPLVPDFCNPLSEDTIDELKRLLSNDRLQQVQEAMNSVLFETPIVHFFLNGYETDGINEFISHITTIEAALGKHPEHQITDKLKKRISTLLFDNRYGDIFDNLYKKRSKYIHGRKNISDISLNERIEVRNLAQKIVNALIERATTTEIQSRKEFLDELSKNNI